MIFFAVKIKFKGKEAFIDEYKLTFCSVFRFRGMSKDKLLRGLSNEEETEKDRVSITVIANDFSIFLLAFISFCITLFLLL